MKTYYQILGLSAAASAEEIRRAYRVLARRYHPDVNPGKSSEERFKEIAQAYAILSDPTKRKSYDADLEKRLQDNAYASTFERAHAAYQRAGKFTPSSSDRASTTSGSRAASERPRQQTAATRSTSTTPSDLTGFARLSRDTFRSIQQRVQSKLLGKKEKGPPKTTHISLVEVSLSIVEAIRGVRKAVEITDLDGIERKISVIIPPGSRPGSVIRFRRKDVPTEEVVLIVRIAPHPFISISVRGLTLDIPITVQEAVSGAKIQIPSLGEPLLVVVDPGTQSGDEVRIRNKGILYRDGSRGDLLVRFQIKIPQGSSRIGLTEKAEELSTFYEKPVRAALPKSILEGS
jgi:DnaJ-class molecular chaperone